MRMAAGGAALAGVGGSLLGACQRPGDSSISIPLPRKNSPVRWPVFADNEPIKSGLPHEDGVLQIYNWVAYINQAVVDGFAKKYHVPTPQITTFNTMSEAIAKLQTGELDFETGLGILELLAEQVGAGRAVLVVTHNREIGRAADRVVELSGGRVQADGPPRGGRRPIRELRW